ncbi:MAG: hypothetical protein QOE84_2536 [Actinomycetota bacterium]|nr:hypothetical protein [Actinomycetota bacterium]MDT7550142.1 hypothetical protein [Actinomycetota bacterium]
MIPLRTRALVAMCLTACMGAAGAAQAGAPKLGPNLAPNPSFEQSSADAATQQGVPVTPVGWSFEGATLVFDYNQRGGHTGARNVAVSGSLAPGQQVCDASTGTYQCAPNPASAVTGTVNDSAQSRYSIRPFWTTAAPVPVTAGKRYRFSVWAIRPSLDPNAGVEGQGAQTRVRWVDASGTAISVVDAASLLKTKKRALGFKLISADLTAPAGAAGAVLMLGHTDYTVTSAQVAFDDVTFQQLG